MQHGAIVQAGPPLELYRQPVNTFVATFLGSPPMNLLDGSEAPGRRERDDRRPARGRRRRLDSRRRLGRGARISVVEPMGSETLVTLEYRAQRLVARVPADRQFEPGQVAYVRLPPERVLWFDASAGHRIYDSET